MSRNLGCNAVHCSYNLDYLCTAERINVEGADATNSRITDCGTFTKKSLMNMSAAKENLTSSTSINSVFKSNEGKMAPEITCDARQCKYNIDKQCNAKDVMIIGDTAEDKNYTQCKTFIQKFQ